MRKIVAAILLCGLALTANAVPARRGWQTRTQADGTTIEVQQMGDEFYHFWITKDGNIAEMQEDGSFIVTNQQQPTGEQVMALRKASKRYVNRAKKIGANTMPARGLFILVSFSDKSFSSASETYYKTRLGDDTEGAKSMYNYLKLQSNGKYAPPIDVFGPVTLSKTVSYYGSNDSQGNDKHPAEMVVEACKALDSQVDFSQYDANKDGVIDNVYVIYAGKGEADGGAKTTIWPHQWNIEGEGLSCTLDGKSLSSYACSSELNGSSKYAMGTPLHEFSHVLGLPDYYDTEYESTNYTEGRTPSDWSLMDAGSYNDNGNTPPNYSIFDKYYLGWDTPKLLAQNDQLTVTLTTEYGDAYQVNGGTTLLDATNTKTIYYIENRQQTGWDAALPGHGMIVWRVMYDESKWENNELNNYSGTTRYTVLSASGDQTNIGKTSDPFPGTKSTKNWTPFTGCAFTEITESNGTITFKYNGGQTKTECTYELLGEHCTVPADGKVATNAALSLTITPDEGYVLNLASCWTVSMGTKDLVYGKDFTYNAETNEFRIEKVTDDVVILAEGKVPAVYTIRFFDNGEQIGETQTVVEGQQANVPANPTPACEGYTFVGWWTEALEADNTQAKSWIENFKATQNQDYYAVYSKTEESEGEPSASVTFKDAETDSNTDASTTTGKIRTDIVETETGISTYSGSKVYAGTYGAKIGTSKASGELTITLSAAISTNTITVNAKQYGSDTGKLSVTVNNGTEFGTAQKPSADGGILTFTGNTTTISSVTIATSSKRAYVKAVTIGTGSGSTTYYSTVENCEPTAIEQAVAQPTAIKAIRNGQLVIIRGTEMYNVTGVRIQ